MHPIKHVVSYLLYCKYAMFYFIPKLPVPPLNINLPSSLWNQNFLTCHSRSENFPSHFGRWNANVMTLPNQLANNKSSKHDSITAEFWKKVYQTFIRLGILGNKEVLKKSQIGWRQMLVPSLPFRNNFWL